MFLGFFQAFDAIFLWYICRLVRIAASLNFLLTFMYTVHGYSLVLWQDTLLNCQHTVYLIKVVLPGNEVSHVLTVLTSSVSSLPDPWHFGTDPNLDPDPALFVSEGFSYYFCWMMEGSGSRSITLNNGSGSGSGRPKILRIVRIRIRNTIGESVQSY